MTKAKPTYNELEKELAELKKRLSNKQDDDKFFEPQKLTLEESVSMLLKIADNVPAYIAIVDAKTLKYKFVNAQFVKGFNIKRDSIIGAHISDVIGEKNTQFAMKYINMVRKGESTSYTNTFDLAEGKRYANVNYVPGFDKNGHVEDIIVLTHDITALKNTEIELVKAKEKATHKEQYSAMLFNSSPVGLALTTISGNLKDVNIAYANIIGYTINETLKLSYWDITPKKYKKQESEQLNKLKTTGVYGPYEKEYIHKSGKLIPVCLEGKIIEIDGEKFIWSSVQDISERKNNEAILKEQNRKLEHAKKLSEESELRYRALHDASSGGIGIHDKGLILDCNQGLADMTGYSVNTLIGMDGLLLIAQPFRKTVLDKIQRGYEKPYEVIGLKKNGKEYPLRIEGRMIPYKGSMVRVVEFRDITDQKIAEQSLKKAKEKAEESEKQLKLIANNFVDGMIYQVVTIDENKRQFTYVSDAVQKLYGCTPAEVMKNPDLIYSRIHAEDVESLIAKEHEALKNMSVFRTETRIINPDNTVRWSFLISQPRIVNDQICWDGFEIDITERKKLENELINAKEQAIESEKLKSAFLANMSHEIRTPLNSILGFSQLLKNDDLSSDDRNKYIDFISHGGNRLLTIISDIVDISKMDANQLRIRLKECNINELLDNIYNQFLVSKTNSSVEIIVKKGLRNNESIIKTDCLRLNQILSNLIENALKFTKNGNVTFGYTKIENELQFFVTDTGIGIDRQHHQVIFDRFSQVNDEFFKTETGTGLGLSIVQGLVKLLRGKIWLESEINKGTSFYFTIPAYY